MPDLPAFDEAGRGVLIQSQDSTEQVYYAQSELIGAKMKRRTWRMILLAPRPHGVVNKSSGVRKVEILLSCDEERISKRTGDECKACAAMLGGRNDVIKGEAEKWRARARHLNQKEKAKHTKMTLVNTVKLLPNH